MYSKIILVNKMPHKQSEVISVSNADDLATTIAVHIEDRWINHHQHSFQT